MRIEYLEQKGTWREVANSANTTIAKDPGEKEPGANWKNKMLLCEHSPIRQLIFKWKWVELPYWVSVHITRHKFGIEHWVRSQRSDRTNNDRALLPQGTYVEHECEANVQALINISRKRLCQCTSPETREAWLIVIDALPAEIKKVCVRECTYRGFCPEFRTCGYYLTEAYKQDVRLYREGLIR